ncbi:MAG: DUF2461 domain-containing protein [bacterium]|nr:DUF2461 domain-containing protein [bacterium]
MTGQTKTTHFTPALFRFLRQLKRNNSREWFAKNKPRYLEDVRDPMLQFIADFGPLLRKIGPRYVADPRPQGGSMFRVHRDTRFSRDKSPYKTMAAAQFRHSAGKDVHAPGFYLHLGADQVFAGAGIWHPDGSSLGKIRDALVENPARWKRVVGARAFASRFRLDGDSLKRAPRGYEPEHPLVEDLKRKDYIAVIDLDEKQVCAPGFLDTFAGICRDARSFVKLLAEAVDLQV